jgi:integrase
VYTRYFVRSDISLRLVADWKGGTCFRSINVHNSLSRECGVRAGELAGLKLADIDGEKLTIVQSV